MVLIDLYAFWAILEMPLLLLGVALWLFWRLRVSRRELAAVEQEGKAAEPAALSHYFTTEAKLTEGRLAALGVQERDGDDHLWLRLRQDYLQVEGALAADLERDAAFWQRLEQGLQPVVAQHCVLPAVETAAPHAAEEAAPEQADAQIHQLVGEQAELLRQLKHLAHGISAEPETVAEFDHCLDRMGRVSGELTVCAGMLEEENRTLRQQLAAAVS